jgi:TolB-like protein/tetratricopeptide (TPR) repeat protein
VTPLLDRLTDAIADGQPVDWEAAESDAGTDDERQIVSQLRVLARVASLARDEESSSSSPAAPAPVPSPLRLAADNTVRARQDATETVEAERKRWRHLEILQLVGQGTFGAVYRAWDSRLQRDVALKLIPAGRTASHSDASVVREGRLLARVRHPNVVSIFDADEADGHVGLWMEFVHGRTLHQIVEANGPLGAREAAIIGLEVARALAAVHSAGLVHRDVKAQNVMRGDGGRVVLMDFGAGEEVARIWPRRVSGTPLYMAPELFDGAPATPHSDIYSLGVLLFFLTTGSHPVSGATSLEVSAAHRAGVRRLLRDERPDLPPAFVRAVDRLLDPDPAKRIQTAGGAEAILERTIVDERQAPRWLALVAGALALAVALMVATQSSLWPRLWGGAGSVESIAVLPLTNLSVDAGSDPFIDGMTDLLIAELSRLKNLRVTARTSVMGYKNTSKTLDEIGRELGVDAVLEASVVMAGPQLRLTASLLRPEDGMRLWTESYERPVKDVLGLQAAVVRDIVSAIRLALSPADAHRLEAPYLATAQAQDEYLRGRALLGLADRRRLQESCGLFESAVEIDPNYALAWAALSRCRVALETYGVLTPDAARDGVVAAATQAIAEDPTLAEAHTALGDARFRLDWDWRGANESYERGVTESPSFSYGRGQYARFLAAAGRADDAVTHARRAVELDPLSAEARATLGMMLFYQRRYDEALQRADEAAALNPSNPGPLTVRGRALSALGRYDEAIATLRKAFALADDPAVTAELGRVEAAAGRVEDAEAALEKLPRTQGPNGPEPVHDAAYVLAALGRSDEALAILERGVDNHSSRVLWLRVDPRVDSLRSSPRFAALLARIGGLD